MNVAFNPMISNNAQWSNAQKINYKGSNILEKHVDKCIDKYGKFFAFMALAKTIICTCLLALVAIHHNSERSHAEQVACWLKYRDPVELAKIQAGPESKPVKDLLIIRAWENTTCCPKDTTFMEKVFYNWKQK